MHENEPVGGTHFHITGFTPRLVLTQRHKATQTWLIMYMVVDGVLTVNSNKYLDSCVPSVDSSQPETSTSSNGAKTEEGSLAVVESSRKPEMSGNMMQL